MDKDAADRAERERLDAEAAELERQRKEQLRAEEKARKEAERERQLKEQENAKNAKLFAEAPDDDFEEEKQQPQLAKKPSEPAPETPKATYSEMNKSMQMAEPLED